VDQCSLLHHVSSIPEVLEDGPQAFYAVRYISGTAKPVALIDSGSLQTGLLRLEDSDDTRGTRGPIDVSPSGGRRLADQNLSRELKIIKLNQEAPEDHRREALDSSAQVGQRWMEHKITGL
jgi:hypothetical protein